MDTVRRALDVIASAAGLAIGRVACLGPERLLGDGLWPAIVQPIRSATSRQQPDLTPECLLESRGCGRFVAIHRTAAEDLVTMR